MRYRTLVAVAVAVVCCTVVVAPVAGAAQGDADDAEPTAGNTVQVNETGETATPDCDYETLYQETVGSVVAIQSPAGAGSGFVYAGADGERYVVTNAHVLGQTDTALVRFAEGETRRGTVVGQDVFADLAVLRVSEMPEYADPLPVADRDPRPGTAVAALGNPFGLDDTVTHGIVSGTNRTLPTTLGFSIPNVVQTDASINPGNSGGPLVDCEGTVVGVNTAGIPSVAAENVGFAVSPAIVGPIVPELIETGTFRHGYLGVSTEEVTPAHAAANDLPVATGAYVASVDADGPAADTLQGASQFAVVDGVRVPVGGDIIVAVEGRAVDSPEALSTRLFVDHRPGETVTLTVVRDGEVGEVDVTLTERPRPMGP